MKISRRHLLQSSAAAATFATLPTACSKGGTDTSNTPSVLDETLDLILNSYPESASSAGIDKGDRADLKFKLTDRSIAGQDAIKQAVSNNLAKLQAIDTSTLDDEKALDIDVVRTTLENTHAGFQFPYGDVALLNSNWSYRNAPYAVAQNVGSFVEIPTFLDSSHQIETSDDADAYLARMKAYAAQLDGETERTVRDGELGVILPDFLMAKSLGQLRGARATAVENWGIVNSISTRTNEMEGNFTAAALEIAKNEILPALDRQIDALEKLAPRATSEAGAWKLPDGEAYYNWALKAGTTTDMTPDEVHEMGLAELADLHAEMDPILQSIGYTEGPVGARMIELAKDKRYHFSEGDKGREEIMAFIEGVVEDIRGRMPQAHETLVPGFLEVTRIPVEVEDGAPGAYGGAGSIDGKQPGHFWINLRSTDLHTTYSLQDLTYHEAIPGHVWQGEYTFKQPLIRSILGFNAYSEGWALYAQQIADELGVYDDFEVGRLGYLQSLAFRACRLVVDTGLHAKRWTRDQAVDWFVNANGSGEAEVRSEVDRYCAWPGQACGYKVGHSAILRLREKAKAELGEKFNYRRFNDALVLGGSVPMTVLGRVIDGYIANEKAR